ncbi:MAG: hypothetical protein UR96_C0001G0016 [candidate division WS6 bacterium GW2011_GWC1_36_11]|uniref:Uncharacterized protein n=3 Tax=Candidatus Dojkabacteria TaxID=74243 RepID=A0A0G0G0A5_9BACT|nr:MAG: hypothetical protein UR96_C0001G0016 [candidate division WS6 bacterium GW2011_GWC1_36_11]KKQ04566.1 MAG: hypothetical protein US14_C0006G0009 [candidate division WS6 bacterium GW2011_WS6_36_26]KKQ10856.1 MAG: hypothetical protein US23_C0020G0003 [candidate division WS6 bacterium GW2011_GWE1_36_69]KKQ12008.1 MAG: hypothetical protein US24_C0007G0008 [candidate division WS6 bacterium GW2011_GWC2_36_7]KKQ15813.1 MAG: hypothetical protein US29_C0036G0006 [candidate division WS6 bacterium GW
MPNSPEMGGDDNQSNISSNEMNSSLVAAARNGEMNFTHDPEMLGNVAPDREDDMAEAAFETQQNAEIERLAMEASAINPDFENGIKTELQETAKETLKMKIESKVYDFLTAVEKKIGKSLVMKDIRESFAFQKSLWGATGSGYFIPDVKLGERNLRSGKEAVDFVPSGESINNLGGLRDAKIAEKPTVDWVGQLNDNIESVQNISQSVRHGASIAEHNIESSTIINKLEEWRGNIKARQESVRGAAQLVSAYGTAA